MYLWAGRPQPALTALGNSCPPNYNHNWLGRRGDLIVRSTPPMCPRDSTVGLPAGPGRLFTRSRGSDVSWVLFQWGSRGLYYDTGLGVYVAHEFIDHGIQVTVFGHGEDAEELLHTFHVSATAVLPDSTDCLAVANAVHGWVIDASDGLNKLCHTGVEFDRVVAQSIAEFEGPFAELVIGSSGTRTGDHMPSLLCMNVKKSSDHGGRSRRGYFAT